MKHLTVFLPLVTLSSTTAWTTATWCNKKNVIRAGTHTTALGMGSRAAKKAQSRQKWAGSRGVVEGEEGMRESLDEFISASASIDITAGKADVAPLLFDLLKIQEYHPMLGTAEIVGDLTEGVGAVRRLNYTDGKTTFLETVKESNGVDRIRLELTEYPMPCELMFANLSTEEAGESTTLTAEMEFKMKEGVPVELMSGPIQGLVQGMVANAKDLVEKSD